MCGRYELLVLNLDTEFPYVRFPRDLRPNRDTRPTQSMPIVRLDEAGDWIGEYRRWGFLRQFKNKQGKLVQKQVINAIGEEVETKRTLKNVFKTARCIIPMHSWYEWPEFQYHVETGEQLTELQIEEEQIPASLIKKVKIRHKIYLKSRPCFGAAGLYEVSKDMKTGSPVETFSIMTVAPGENSPFLEIHDRAPLILQQEDYEAWLAPDNAFAKALIEPYRDQDDIISSPMTKEDEAKLMSGES